MLRNTEDFLGIDTVKLFIQLSWSNIRKFEIGQKHNLNALILCKNVLEFEEEKIPINSRKRIAQEQHINDRLQRSWIHLKRFGNGSDKGGKGGTGEF